LPALSDLASAQRLLSELVRLPESVEKTLSLEGLSPRLRALESLICGDESLPVWRRLDVYANGYFFRILEALLEDYAGLNAALGDTRFHNLVTAYLLECPSSATSMRDVGARLPLFIASDPHAADVREEFPWAESLARLERTLVDVFDAADAEVATREDYAGLVPELFVSLCFELQPSVLRLTLDWPVVGLRTAHDRKEPLERPVEPAIEHALCWRNDERVFYRKLGVDEADVLEGLAQGLRFAELCERASQHVGEEAAPGHVATWLMRWLGDGCLVRDASLEPTETT